MPNNLISKTLFFLTGIAICLSCNTDKANQSTDEIVTESKTKRVTTDDPIHIVLTIWGGNHFYSLIIGSDSMKVEDNYNSVVEKQNIDTKGFDDHRYVLSQNAVDHIWKYVQNKCVAPDGKLASGERYYNISKSSGTLLRKTGCVVESKEEGVAYFNGLIKWIKDSPYELECKVLIQDIQEGFVDGTGFPFTSEQIKTLKDKGNESR